MDIITSVFSICSNVSDTGRQYKILAAKLKYEIQKTEHLFETEKVKMAPKFIIQNLKSKLYSAKSYLEKIQNLIKEDDIPFKEKIKLSLPFNRMNLQVRNSLEQLEKAQQDVNEYFSQGPTQINGKRSMEDLQKIQKKQQTMFYPGQDVEDQDIQEALMGPTIEENAAIQFTKNKYIQIQVQIHGTDKIIQAIKQVDGSFLVYRKKIQVKFQNTQKKSSQELQLFSLGRLFFKPVYSKLKPHFPDIDRISKQNHFVVSLKRQRYNVKDLSSHVRVQNQKATDTLKDKLTDKLTDTQLKQSKIQPKDQFFSFPITEEAIVIKQFDKVVVKRAADKNTYCLSVTDEWKKMEDTQKQLFTGEEIAPCIPSNKLPFKPDLYFKIHFDMTQ